MTYIKNKFLNFKSEKIFLKAIIFTISFLFLFPLFVKATDKEYKVILPQKVSGIEKIEYLLNDEPQGSTAGVGEISLKENTKINFLIKFESIGYNQLKAGDLKILSNDETESLSLNIYKYDEKNNIITQKVSNEEIINPNQIYVTSDKYVLKDEVFKILDVNRDAYNINLNLMDVNEVASNIMNIKYQTEDKKIYDAIFNENTNNFEINNIEDGKCLKIWCELKPAYTQSNLEFYLNESDLKKIDQIFYLPNIKSDINLNIHGVRKNIYSLNFDSSNISFYSLEDSSLFNKVDLVEHGKNYYFKCDSISENMEILANGLVIRPIEGIYKLNSISENIKISVGSKENSKYPINFKDLEGIADIMDLNGNLITDMAAPYGKDFSFKIKALPAYTQHENEILLYAIPEELSETHLEDISSYLLTPSNKGEYFIKSVEEPLKIFVRDANINTYKVSLPSKLIGANYEILEDENVSLISSNEALITHGKPLNIVLSPEPGYDLSNVKFKSDEQNIKVIKNENVYSLSNINASTDVLIDKVEEAKHSVTFDSARFNFLDQNNTIINSSVLVSDTSGAVKFWLEPKSNESDSEINISLNGGNAKLEKPKDGSKLYTLYDVHEDINISVNVDAEVKSKKLTLSSSQENLEFRANTESNELLPKENVIDSNSNFEFQVYSSNGESLNNVNVDSINGATIKKIAENPLTYSVDEVSESANISLSSSDLQGLDPAQINNEDQEYWCPVLNFEIVCEPENAFTTKFLNALNLNGPTNKTTDIRYEKNDAGRYNINYENIIFEVRSNICNSNDGCEVKFYSDAEMKNEITMENSYIGLSSVEDDSKNSMRKILTIDRNIQHDKNYRYYEPLEEGSSIKVNYSYKTIYIKIVPSKPTKFKVNFPELEGIEFYKVAGIESIYKNNEFLGYEVMEGEKINSSSVEVENKDNMNFILKVNENYEWNSLKVSPEEFMVLDKYENVLTEKNKNLYEIKDIYCSSVNVQVEGLKKKKVNVDFSDSVGSNFFRSNGGALSIDEPYELDYGSTFEFYTNAKKGFKKEINDFILTVGEKIYHLYDVDHVIDSTNSSVRITSEYDENENLKITLSNIKGNLDIRVIRERELYKIKFPKIEGINFRDLSTDNLIDCDKGLSKSFESIVSFIIESGEEVNIQDVKVKANGIEIPLINNRYTINKISEDINIKVENYTKSKNNVILTAYDGVTYKDAGGKEINENKAEAEYEGNFEFSISLGEFISHSKITVKAEGIDSQNVLNLKYNYETGRYLLENIKEDYKITIQGIEINDVSISLNKMEGITYYNQYGTEKLISENQYISNAIIQKVKHGESFSFRIIADPGVDISSLMVWYKHSESDKSPVLISSINGVYTIENITGPYIIYTGDVQKLNHEVEIRTTEGVKCLDVYGNTLNSKISVANGESLSFKLSIDNTYNKSTPVVEVKGSLNKLNPSADGIYTLENITENKIIDIKNITKNTYKVNFKPAEGVIYKTAKNKPFTDYLEVEYGSILQFKITLMDAYDESIPYVLLNGREAVAGNGGLYSVENINSDVEISVENVVKNPEELTMEEILSIPSNIVSSSDVDKVVNATRFYNGLSEEEKSLITNLDELQNAQKQSEAINHYAENISVTGIDWNIKLIVTSLNEDKSAIDELNAEIERKSLINLYEIKLYNTLTGEYYEVPYGKEVSVTMPCPDVSQYENIVVVHKNSGGGIEYLDVNIRGDVAQFKTSSFSRFGIAAKKIPNYSENPSDIKISVSDLVENDEEIQSLLGENVASQLGELINLDEETESEDQSGDLSPDLNDSKSTNSSDSVFGKLYDWAINHELLAVILILVIGSLILWLIFIFGRRKEEK